MGDSDLSPVVSTLPLFHSFGQGTLLRSLCNGTRLVVMRAERPVTVDRVWKIMDAVNAKRLASVPYILKFFTETPGGLERLTKLSQVMAGGSAVPQDLGDKLVGAGIDLLIGYGQTESGPLARNDCKANGGKDWNWYRLMDTVVDHVYFEPVGEGLFHLICRPTLPTLVLHDREDGGYNSKDLVSLVASVQLARDGHTDSSTV